MTGNRRERTALRVVGGDGDEAGGVFERGFEAPPPTARPADRCEPWFIEDGAELRALADAASRGGVAFGLAAVLVVERRLLAVELATQGLDGEFARRLDAEAACANVTVELSASLSAYLVALSGHSREAAGSVTAPVALPMRLTERILARQVEPQFDAALLPSALMWERAAVLEGHTMSEWAALKVLELSC
jgi:hypothetical protein